MPNGSQLGFSYGLAEAGTPGTIARPVASESLTLAYDGRGFLRRADDAVTGGWLEPVYASEGRLMSLARQATGAATTERINVLYFAGRPVAIWRKVGTATATWNPVVTDHLGTPVYALTQAGAQHWLGGFEPFGRDHQQGTGQDSLTKGIFLRLPGQWDDALLAGATLGADVYYNVHRWYEPATGRYSSPDPVGGSVDPNLFRYALGNPTVYSDPDGLAPRPLSPSRTRVRPCDGNEYSLCVDICLAQGKSVESCRVSQTWRVVRQFSGMTVWEWVDGQLSCSCQETKEPYCARNPGRCALVAAGVCVLLLTPIPDDFLIPVLLAP